MQDARKVFEISGSDRISFLQGLVTNNVSQDTAGLIYAALLTPQGKYLADFFLLVQGDRVLLDADANQADALIRRLTMYRLRADVVIAASDLQVSTGTGDLPTNAYPDPRHAELGWRQYGPEQAASEPELDDIRVRHCIPKSGVELIPDDTYILEAGFERLNGVDFRKGCYVGQEVTARMHHKTELRKGFRKVALSALVPVGTDIIAGDRKVGKIYTQSNGQGIAYLRFDKATDDMAAGDARVTLAD